MVEHRLRPLTPSKMAPMAKAVAKIISESGRPTISISSTAVVSARSSLASRFAEGVTDTILTRSVILRREMAKAGQRPRAVEV